MCTMVLTEIPGEVLGFCQQASIASIDKCPSTGNSASTDGEIQSIVHLSSHILSGSRVLLANYMKL